MKHSISPVFGVSLSNSADSWEKQVENVLLKRLKGLINTYY